MFKTNPYMLLHDPDAKVLDSPIWRSTAKFWILVLCVLGGSLYLIDFMEIISVQKIALNLSREPTANKPQLPDFLQGYLVNTPGCRIPEMDPYDSSVKAYVYPPHSINCRKGQPPSLFYNNLTTLILNTSSLSFYGISNSTGYLFCCYEEFIRRQPKESEDDYQVTYSGNCTKITNRETNIEGEFIKLVCQDSNGVNIYEDFFSFVPAKRIPLGSSNKLKPNVMIIGLDAVSRVNLHRQLPKTYKYLSQELKAIELLGYNKIGDNTFPNLVAVLAGAFEKELPAICWPEPTAHFDNCPFIWKEFQKHGYVTAIGEDCSPIGIFNYLKNGFGKQPSDYYYTIYDREILAHIGHKKDFNCFQCLGNKDAYKVTLDYVRKFAQRMNIERSPYFALFWTNSLSHDYLNRPAAGDDNFLELFVELNHSGHLDNTIMIFMSDHGIRWGDIRRTYQGQLEERLPFVIITIPSWLRQEYPQAMVNLKTNVRRLTTPFDLHETLRALLDVTKFRFSRKIVNEEARGYSLFNEIPKNRTCRDAQIVSHWCTCQESKEIPTNDTAVVKSAHFAVDQINFQLQGYAQCAVLKLAEIQRARMLTYNTSHITDKKSVKDYTLVLKTEPGDGLFEVTVRAKLENVDENQSQTHPSQDHTITGSISRINPYGKQSSCITDFHLKLYCFCKTLIKL